MKKQHIIFLFNLRDAIRDAELNEKGNIEISEKLQLVILESLNRLLEDVAKLTPKA